jgi:hypothetical protein
MFLNDVFPFMVSLGLRMGKLQRKISERLCNKHIIIILNFDIKNLTLHHTSEVSAV